ncbi:MAG: hypothetical protein ACXWQO_11035 [Bdellovibrionota bacterium]
MKQLFIAALITFTATSAFANPTSCRENVDHGYSVNFSRGFTMAQVLQTTIADTKVVANLKCGPAEVLQTRRDGIVVVASCYEPELRDAGYSLTVKQNRRNGATMATLYEVSFVGSKPIAEMGCQ